MSDDDRRTVEEQLRSVIGERLAAINHEPDKGGNPVVVFLSLAGVAAGITMVWFGMRAVMDVGGFCAQGGPFEIAVRCPERVSWLMMGGIWGGMIAAGVYAWHTAGSGVPKFTALFWPGLFLSLGWNFLEYGLSPPEQFGGGVSVGWIVCGVLFVLMGLPPLLWWLGWIFGKDRPTLTERLTARAVGSAVDFAQRATPRMAAVLPAPTPAPSADTGFIEELERLQALLDSGALTDSEFRRAKRRILGGSL